MKANFINKKMIDGIFMNRQLFNLCNRKTKKLIFFVLLFLLCVSENLTNAQQVITLHSAIQAALQNNLTIRSQRLQTEYQKALIGASSNISQANIYAEVGQFNSIYRDNRLGIQQGIEFPTVYSNQRKLARKEWERSLLTLRHEEAELIKRVEMVYSELLVAFEKEKLLKYVDSLFFGFIRKTTLKFEKGDVNILEKVTAESQGNRIRQQLQLLHQEIFDLNIQLKFLLNSEDEIFPDSSNLLFKLKLPLDTASIIQHPSISIIQKQILMADIELKINRSKLLPNMMAGYSSTTIRGIGADDIFYNSSHRFNAAQFGIGIPLFFGSQKSSINATKFQKEIATNNLLAKSSELKGQLKSNIQKYITCNERIQYYINQGLPNANLIIETANQQFTMGEIGYLDWVILMNQAFEIKNSFTDAIQQFNQTVIEINYLTFN